MNRSSAAKQNPFRCYEPTRLYKPQWAYKTPDGFRDETFLVPFTFTVPGNGSLVRQLPWQLDDDVPYIIRGILFPEIGQVANDLSGFFPGLARIWDTHGNPLSQGLVLGLGMWCQGGVDIVGGQGSVNGSNYGWGFPIEPEIECAPGGALLFDFQLATNATIANFFVDLGGGNFMTYWAGVFGIAGNGRTIQLIDPGAPNVALSIAVVGVNVQITLATNGGGVITTTAGDIANLLLNTPAAVGVMAATINGDPTTVVTAFGPSALTGAAASTPITLNGCFIGVKRFKDC